MTFVSYEFLIFLTIVLVLYWIVQVRRWQNLLLLASSYVFYGWLVPWHVLVLFLSTLVDFLLALGMSRVKSQARLFLWLGVLLNIALLSFVKYYFSFNNSLGVW